MVVVVRSARNALSSHRYGWKQLAFAVSSGA